MNRTQSWWAASAVALACMAASPAWAAPVVTNVSVPDAGFTVPDSLQGARNTFLAQFDATQTESFSSAAVGALDPDTRPTLPVFTGGTLTPTFRLGETYRVRDTTFEGRFDTTCLVAPAPCSPRFLEASGSFNLSFGGAFNGFGFYGTDIGEFLGTLQLELIRSDGQTTRLGTVNFDNGTGNGGALFYGFFDDESTYTGVNVFITQGNPEEGFDFFGFDDLVLGRLDDDPVDPNPTPEPGSLALVGASLLALTAVRRRRKA